MDYESSVLPAWLAAETASANVRPARVDNPRLAAAHAAGKRQDVGCPSPGSLMNKAQIRPIVFTSPQVRALRSDR